jgi:hypothetical protein
MMRRKMNPFRIFPVMDEMRPTTAGPTNEADLSVKANREKKDDSWFCSSVTDFNKVKRYTGGINSAYTARL